MAQSEPNEQRWSFQLQCHPAALIHNDGPTQAAVDAAAGCDATTSSVPEAAPDVPASVRESFRSDGFVVFRNVVPRSLVDDLNERLEHVLRGNYDLHREPDRMPQHLLHASQPTAGAGHPLGFNGDPSSSKVLQIINIHKADARFRRLACSPVLGRVVAQLTGWRSVRLAQDQVWAKPPGAPPLSFHRDAPYFMFDPPDVVTVWVALDDMAADRGPLAYVRGSHVWGDTRAGSAQQFFQTEGGRHLLELAAQANGIHNTDELDALIVSMAGLTAGSISIHDGRTWHGSGQNQSQDRPRRGLGLHFVPGHVKFTAAARKSRLWRRYVEDDQRSSNGLEDMTATVPDDDFVLIWTTENDGST